ncbi:MAG: ornithine cyclodeaminase family protein [Anaerolineae bacterium]
MKLRILSSSDVRQAVTMAEAIQAVKEAYIQLSAGQAVVPLRTPVPVEKRNGVTLFMPAYLAQSDALGAKIVSVFPGNLARGLPLIHALVIVVDAETGCPIAIMDGTYLTALRTGAASGVATDLLARPEASVVAIFGAGAQARTQLEAVCTVRDIRQVWVYDVVADSVTAYVKEMKQRGRPIPSEIHIASSPAQAVREADIICTATTSRTPVFDNADLKPGVHINGIGSYTPEMQEVPAETVARARVVLDSRLASLAEAGDLIIPLQKGLIQEKDIHGEIGEVAAGKIPGRQSAEEITFFKSVGVAVQDVAVATLILRRATDLGLGVLVDL